MSTRWNESHKVSIGKATDRVDASSDINELKMFKTYACEYPFILVSVCGAAPLSHYMLLDYFTQHILLSVLPYLPLSGTCLALSADIADLLYSAPAEISSLH